MCRGKGGVLRESWYSIENEVIWGGSRMGGGGGDYHEPASERLGDGGMDDGFFLLPR